MARLVAALATVTLLARRRPGLARLAAAPNNRPKLTEPFLQRPGVALVPQHPERAPHLRALVARERNARVLAQDRASARLAVRGHPKAARDGAPERGVLARAEAGVRARLAHVARDGVGAAEHGGATSVRAARARHGEAEVEKDEVALEIGGAREAARATGARGEGTWRLARRPGLSEPLGICQERGVGDVLFVMLTVGSACGSAGSARGRCAFKTGNGCRRE